MQGPSQAIQLSPGNMLRRPQLQSSLNLSGQAAGCAPNGVVLQCCDACGASPDAGVVQTPFTH
eukprot:1158923-Pelagomonas_calceolata.AAC.2